MVFDWAKYLVLAEELGTSRMNEAALRSAISRAYYATFCKARNHLRHEGVRIPNTGKAHKIVWGNFRNDIDQHRRSIGITGDRLRQSRNKADYEDEFPNVTKVVQDSISKAKRLLETLENLDGEP